MPPNDNSKGFFQYGNEGTNLDYSYEDALVGNKEGLEYLRDRITDVLERSEDVLLHDNDIETEFTYIALAEIGPTPKETKNDKLFMLGCLTVALITIALLVLGVMKAIEIIA